jgi:uncharacterized protein (TIGR02996 family)
MTDGDALRRAVIANRDDDTPRLIYADWLDENGQSDRATFIRAQVEAARAEPFSPAARNAERRADGLLKLHRKDWTRHLSGSAVEEPGFQRGFIERLGVEVKPISLSSLCALFDIEPLQALKIVRFANEDEFVDFLPVFELTQLQQLRQLQIISATGFIHDEYSAMLQATHLMNIQKLSLRGNPIHPPWLVEMLSSNAFPNLIGLDVADIPNIGPALLSAITKISHREFKYLDASGVVLNSEQMQHLLSSRCLRNLEELRLCFSGLAGEAGPLFHLDIGWVIPWGRLMLLDLNGQRLGDDAVRAIAFQDEARSLRWLGLANNVLGPDAIRILIKTTHLTLNYLDVRGNRFTPMAISALKERFPEALIVHS